jgi:hypothetical protein
VFTYFGIFYWISACPATFIKAITKSIPENIKYKPDIFFCSPEQHYPLKKPPIPYGQKEHF